MTVIPIPKKWSKDLDLSKLSVSCEGRLIDPLGSDENFPSWNEMFHGLMNLKRFCGQQKDIRLDWNVLKHCLAVALLCDDFIVGLLHDYMEMFTNDTPTPYKTEQQREFEKKCYIRMSQFLEDNWLGFSGENFLDTKYKHADAIMLDIEAIHVIESPEDLHKEIFKYDKRKYKVDYDKDKVERLYKTLVNIPSEQVFLALRTLMEELSILFKDREYDKKIVDKVTANFVDLFDIEKVVRNRFRELDLNKPIEAPPTVSYKRESYWFKNHPKMQLILTFMFLAAIAFAIFKIAST
jgi:hypothetical protein